MNACTKENHNSKPDYQKWPSILSDELIQKFQELIAKVSGSQNNIAEPLHSDMERAKSP